MAFTIERGTNVSHWLSQSDVRGPKRRAYFTHDDVKQLADLGLDHLRIPIDEEQMWDEQGNREPEAWELLNSALDWCYAEGLRAIIDLHVLRSHHFVDEEGANTLFTDEAEAEHLAEMWRDLSAEFHGRSTKWVAYELMNEAVADDPEDWNRVLLYPYRAIRELEPERAIAVGSNRWCQAQTFPYLKVPENDPNLILVLHFYNPMLITHYKANWAQNIRDYEGPVSYPGHPVAQEDWDALDEDLKQRLDGCNEYYDRAAMERFIQPAIAKAKEYNLPLWCNEFGVVSWVEERSRRAWYRDFVSVLEDNGIAWSNWDLRGNFGLFDASTREPTIVIEALLGNVAQPA